MVLARRRRTPLGPRVRTLAGVLALALAGGLLAGTADVVIAAPAGDPAPSVTPATAALILPPGAVGYIRATITTAGFIDGAIVRAAPVDCDGADVRVRPPAAVVDGDRRVAVLVLVTMGKGKPAPLDCAVHWQLDSPVRSGGVTQRLKITRIAGGVDPPAAVRRVPPGHGAPFTAVMDVPVGPDGEQPVAVKADADCPATVRVAFHPYDPTLPEAEGGLHFRGTVTDTPPAGTSAGSPPGVVTSCRVRYRFDFPAGLPDVSWEQSVGVDVDPAWEADPAIKDLPVRLGDRYAAAAATLAVPRLAPTVPTDLVLLLDLTGQMRAALNTVQRDANVLVGLARTLLVDARVGVAAYGGSPPLSVSADLAAAAGSLAVLAPISSTDDQGTAAESALHDLSTDATAGPTLQLDALHMMPKPDVGAQFRAAARKVVLWLGGSPGFEPLCASDGTKLTRKTVGAQLAAADVQLIPVSVTQGDDLLGLDAGIGGEGSSACAGPPAPGQGTAVAEPTGGPAPVHIVPDDASTALFAALLRPAEPVRVRFGTRCAGGARWELTGAPSGVAGERVRSRGPVVVSAEAVVGSTSTCLLLAQPVVGDDRTERPTGKPIAVSILKVRVLAPAGLELPATVDATPGETVPLAGALRAPDTPIEGFGFAVSGVVSCEDEAVTGKVTAPTSILRLTDKPVAGSLRVDPTGRAGATVRCTVTLTLDPRPLPGPEFSAVVAVRVGAAPGVDPADLRLRMPPDSVASHAVTVRPPRTGAPVPLEWATDCVPGLTVTLDTPSTVDGVPVTGTETLQLAADVTPGRVLTCAVSARLAGKPDERLGQTVTVTAVATAGVQPRSTALVLLPGVAVRVPLTVHIPDAEGAAVTVGAATGPCDTGLAVRAEPPAQQVRPGVDAEVTAAVAVAPTARPASTLGCDVVIELDGRTSDALTAHLEVVVAAPPAAVPATARAVLGSGAHADLPWTVTTGPPGGDTVTIHPSYECASGLTAVAVPTEVTVVRGEPARMVDRVTADASARPGDVLDCTVTVVFDAYPVSRRVSVLVSGADPSAVTLPVARGGTGAVARRLVLGRVVDPSEVRVETRCDGGLSSASTVTPGPVRTELLVRETVTVATRTAPRSTLHCTGQFLVAGGRLSVSTAVLVLDAGVRPASVELTLQAGATADVPTEVVPPLTALPDRVDVLLLADTTSSMGDTLTAVQKDARGMLGTVRGLARDPRFGAADYRDVVDGTTVFRLGAPIPAADDGGATAVASIDAWTADGGGDTPEAQLLALHRLATGKSGFRAGATRIVVWFGDAPAVDPLCATETGLDQDLTEAGVTAELRAARITVVAVSINGGLDDDPGAPRQTCAPGGSIGQAGRITAATGGFVVDAASAAEVPLRLAQAIGGRLVDVRPELVACDSGLSVVVTGLPGRAAGGVAVAATVRVAVDGAATPGTRTCVLDWLVGGRSLGPLFRQTLRVSTPPEDPCDRRRPGRRSWW